MSGIKLAGLSPHPPVVVPEVGGESIDKIEKTQESMRQFAQQIKDSEPDLIITISPHGPVFTDAISILNQEQLTGDFGQFGVPELELSYPLEEDFVEEIVRACQTQNIQVARIDKGAARKFNIELKLDHGVLVPMYYLEEAGVEAPLVPITMGMLSYEDLYKFGKIIQLLAENLDYDIALIASGDLSHRLTPDAPAGYNPKGEEFDEKIMAYLDQLEVESIMNLDDDLIEKAGECGLRPITIMLGALDNLETEGGVMSYEGPFGVGYGVASYQVKGKQEGTDYFEKIEKRKENKLQEIREQESEIVQLAREAVETYAQEAEVIEPPEPLPEELAKQAGVFVSIKKDGNLRGCIGVTKPTQSNLAEEIIQNAIQAGFKDPRFDKIKVSELKELTYTVDILGEPEHIDSKEELDPNEYGVIVRKGQSTGLLLPNLEGINSVKKQLEVAKRKAGLDPKDEDIELMRFEVRRYE